ncbi:hypothetical protein PybrP1_003124 [[Pythium] brassicae (nom. inval.)]|nr:hypothetical protein PybrP1_003124 [[Pythium] brassicae (nom. inval.)]
MLIQPMDQDVIALLKRGFNTRRDAVAVDRFFDGDVHPFQTSVFEGIEWCLESWKSVPACAIKHCWMHSQLMVNRVGISKPAKLT